MNGGGDLSGAFRHAGDPIDYEGAVKELLRRRRRRKFLGLVSRLPDPRPSSPGQVVLVGLIAVIAGWLVPAIHVATLVGVALLIFGFASGFIQPRGKKVVWRNRNLEIPPERRWTDRIYRLLYRHTKD